MKERKRKELPYDCIIDVDYMPFPSEEKKREAYYINAKLFLRAKERAFKESYIKPSDNIKKGSTETPLSYH